MNHGSYVDVPRRSVTDEENGWIRDLVAANEEWRNVRIEPLFVIAACTCGCRSVVLEQPTIAERPELVGHQGLVAEMSLRIQTESIEDVVSVLLLHANGSLSVLEVVWYNFPDPVPPAWTELNREVRKDS
jgi:Ni/Fe-hydrogenase subunit HybB-like protein